MMSSLPFIANVFGKSDAIPARAGTFAAARHSPRGSLRRRTMLTRLATASDVARNTAVGGGLMILVGLAAALAARRTGRIPWRWLGCGALLWAVSTADKWIL